MTSNNNVFMVFPRLGRHWLGSSAQHKPETSEGRTQMEQEKEGTCALWLFVSPKSSAPGIFPIAKISEPPKSRTCPSHLPFCQKGIFESYVMCLVSGRFCTYPTLCHLPLVYIYILIYIWYLNDTWNFRIFWWSKVFEQRSSFTTHTHTYLCIYIYILYAVHI